MAAVEIGEQTVTAPAEPRPIEPDRVTAASGRRIAPRQVLRLAFWPLWLGMIGVLLSLLAPWTASLDESVLSQCAPDVYCPYGVGPWTAFSTGGTGAGVWTLPILAALVVTFMWAARRRDIQAAPWFARVPLVLAAGFGLIGLVNLPQLTEGWSGLTTDAGGYYVAISQPAWGLVLYVIALVPLLFGIRRAARRLGLPPILGAS